MLTAKDEFLEVVRYNTVFDSVRGEGCIWESKAGFLFTDGSGTFLNLETTDIYLEDFHAITKRVGYGTQAMKWIREVADDCGIRILLHACAQERTQVAQERLVKFYQKHNFSKLGENLMVCPPK